MFNFSVLLSIYKSGLLFTGIFLYAHRMLTQVRTDPSFRYSAINASDSTTWFLPLCLAR